MSIIDFGETLDTMDKRLTEVEQIMTSPGVMGMADGEVIPPIVVDDGTNPPVPITPAPPDVVGNLSATPGAFYDDIFVDVDWDEPVAGTQVVAYDVELALHPSALVYDLESVGTTGGSNYRFSALQPNTNYSVRVMSVSAVGVRSVASAWVDFTTGADTTIPPAPVGVVVGRGAGTAVVSFTPLSAAQAPDVANGNGLYEVQIDTVNVFNTGNLKTIRSSASVVAFSIPTTEASYYARVSAIDASGNQGPWSAVAGPTLAGSVIDSMVVAGLDAAKITFGVMSGDRITANTMDVGRIKTSTLTAANITINGGSFKMGNPPSTGVLINSQGIRGYTAGVLSFSVDAATGNATFQGVINGSILNASIVNGTEINGGIITGSVIQTRASGRRIELTTGWDLLMYSGSPYETSPAVIDAGTVTGGIFGTNAPVTLVYSPLRGAEASSIWLGAGDGSAQPGIELNSGGPSASKLTITSTGGDFYKALHVWGNITCESSLTVVGAKNFRIPHPTKEGKTLTHSALEGPESAVYYRGKDKLAQGFAIVELPEFFEALVDLNDRTVHVTPLSPGSALGASIPTSGRFRVQSDSLTDDREFCWVVYGHRGDLPRLEIENDVEEPMVLTEALVH